MSTWTDEELLAVKHFGPAIIGQEMYEAAQAVAVATKDGIFGPALLASDPIVPAPIVEKPAPAPVKSDPEPPATPPALDTLSYQALRSMAAERGLKFESSPNRQTLVAALEAAA